MANTTVDTPTREQLSVLIGAGGTGGHIYPGLALADELRRLTPGVQIAFVGTKRGLETDLIPAAGYPLHTVDMIPFDRNLGARRYLLPAYLLRSAAQVRALMAEHGVSIGVGMGGYPSSPVVLAARMHRIPALIHESNAVPGRANRLNARLTSHVCLGFEDTRAHLPRSARSAAQTVGMPLYAPLTRYARRQLRAQARAHLRIGPDQRLILVNGGSQGAQSLTEAATVLAERWQARLDVRFLIKTGPAALARTQATLADSGGAAVATATAYLDRMDLAYAAADLILCRAGSATVAELACCGLPAVLVPYPHAPGDHQRHNATMLTRAGAGVLIPENELNATRLAAVLGPLLAHPARLEAMGAATVPGDHAYAATRIAERVLEIASHANPIRNRQINLIESLH